MKSKDIMRMLDSFMKKNGAKLLTGLAIGGFFTAGILAVKVTPEASRRLESKKKEENVEKLPVKEVVKETWKLYLPPILIATTSAGCMIGATSMAAHQTAVLATAYAVSDTAFKEYRAKTKELVGEKKEQEIHDKIAMDKLKNNPYDSREVIMTGKPEALCFEAFSNRYFRSTIEEVRQIENRLNRRLLDDMYISLNDYYDEIGLSHTKIGNELGWSVKDGLIEFKYSSQLAEDGTPCLVIDAYLSPDIDYMNKW